MLGRDAVHLCALLIFLRRHTQKIANLIECKSQIPATANEPQAARGTNLPPVVVRMPDGNPVSIPAVETSRQVEEQLQSWDCTFKDVSTSDFVVGQTWGRVGSLYFL